MAAVPGQDFVLTSDKPGTLESLQWSVPAHQELGAQDVRVQVGAAGLNFSDVMRALGLYPTEGQLGIEMAGTVTGLGANVTDLKIGDRVFGIAPGAFASQVQVPRDFLVATPNGLSDVEAAAMPLVFATCNALSA